MCVCERRLTAHDHGFPLTFRWPDDRRLCKCLFVASSAQVVWLWVCGCVGVWVCEAGWNKLDKGSADVPAGLH